MKRNRIIWFVLWILSVVGISLYGGTISYSFFFMMTGIPLVSLLYLLCVYSFFKVYQFVESKTLVVDQQMPYLFMLKNETFFGFAGIKVQYFSSFSDIVDLDDNVEYELLPKEGIEKETMLICRCRGEYEVGIKTIEIQDFLRLFRISYHNKSTVKVEVSPKLVYLNGLPQVDEQRKQEAENNIEAEPDVLVRQYVAGDDLRRMHWGLSAKNQQYMVRKNVGERQKTLGVLMDTARYESSMHQYIPVENKMMELYLAIALYCVDHKIPIQAYYMDQNFHADDIQESAQFEMLYKKMCGLNFRSGHGGEELYLQAAKEQSVFYCETVFLVLHKWSDESAKLAVTLQDYGVKVVVYVIDWNLDGLKNVTNMARIELHHILPTADLMEVIG